jgi:hypothetical protein
MRLLLLSFIGIVALAAGDAPLDRATLRGLKAVSIVLDPLDAELQKQGLTAQDLKTRLEERLRAANIAVDASASEFVGLRVAQVRGNRGPFALSFTLGAYQPVILVRDQNIKTATSTWEVETIVVADVKALREASLESIDDLAGRFASAWHSVNPQ